MLSTVAKHWATCRRLQTAPDRMLYVYGRVLRRIRWGLPARRAIVKVRLRDQTSPFYLRLGSTDWLVLEEIFHRGEYSFVESHLEGARWIVDLGANAGFSVRYWHALYSKAHITAVEPDPVNCRMCGKNISAAAMGARVKLVRAAVGAQAGRAELTDEGGEWAYQVRQRGSGRGVPVDVYPLLQILDQDAPEQTVDLLKCDIEGAERELFADCSQWINRVMAMVIELHPPYGITDLQKDLSRAGAKFRLAELSTKKACPVAFLTNLKGRAEVPKALEPVVAEEAVIGHSTDLPACLPWPPRQ